MSDAPVETSKPRKIIMTPERLEQLAKAREKGNAKRQQLAALKKCELTKKNEEIMERMRKVGMVDVRVDAPREEIEEEAPKSTPQKATRREASPGRARVERPPSAPVPRKKVACAPIAESDSSPDTSDDDNAEVDVLKSIKQRYKNKYAAKYKQRYKHQFDDGLIKGNAKEILKSKMDKSLLEFALKNISQL